ncbi:hypothetical protein [Achromobacter denitrificans]|uniref:hypothetical protein n=1 Tax=Achromobacter denitrificans TaxID=32002 RepID=UPI00240DC8BB|nr:hypothetical protein [Achromobacter denitrificans]
MQFYVQFSDSTDEEIIAAFGSPQDPAAWPSQGIVADSDPRWLAFVAKFPTNHFDNINP